MINTTKQIPLEKLDLPADARTHDPEALKQLTQDMKVQGQLQEIIVMRTSAQSTVNSKNKAVQDSLSTVHRPLSTERYEVIAGVGRTLAARALGWKEIRAYVRENVSEFDRARITFAENEDREEVDAYYQATLIAKMLKVKKSQAELSRDLGISTALVSDYVSITALPSEISKTFRRLNVGQLTQIARLNTDESKIEVAKICATQDWSVRETKARVDKLLGAEGKTTHKLKTTPVDPLAADWEKAHITLMELSSTAWEADYKDMPLPGGGQRKPGWSFTVWPQVDAPDAAVADAATPKAALARWFGQMAAAMGNPPASAATEKTFEQSLIESSMKEQSMMKKLGKLISRGG